MSDKVSKLRAARAQTGNRPVENDLTEMDKKILGVIGYDFAEGVTNSFDSFPEEQVIQNSRSYYLRSWYLNSFSKILYRS